ncbi:ferritin-like domain-containing protein [Lentinula raphanica]|nr:ferritin-like domain-containing protein [Lentinula raphanica]KAJ3777054.1 ferritin-like domain-containing protein [Lentinula raphanica]KAJ3827821.1 ferritin-like domain-containing protein [Lentinula raphanica]
MRFSTSLLTLAVPLAANAAPLHMTKRQAAAIDVTVLQFANTLEQLESQFYAAGLSKFQDSDFQAAGFSASSLAIQQITNIQSDEATHASVLEEELTALGQNPNSTCSFNFDSALTDVATMAATARVVENLGVSAYLGAASLLTDPQLLEAAGSILTVEARHQTILNVLSGTGTAIPSAFDLALTPSEVLAVASPFFSGTCDLGLPANPTLTVTNTGTVSQGTSLTFSSTAINSSVDTSSLFCQMLVGGNPISISLPYSQCVVPNTVNGPVAIFITTDNDPLQSNVVNRASANSILAGPTLAFIDAQPETLGEMVRSSSSSSSGSSSSGSSTDTAAASSSTQTISPDAAESIISSQGASATDSAAAASSTSSSSSNSVNDSSDPSAPFRDDFTGLAPGGVINVIGWSNIPSN